MDEIINIVVGFIATILVTFVLVKFGCKKEAAMIPPKQQQPVESCRNVSIAEAIMPMSKVFGMWTASRTTR